MLQGEHSAILLTFIKLPFSIKTFVLSICRLLFKTGFTVCNSLCEQQRLIRLCGCRSWPGFIANMGQAYFGAALLNL